MNPEELANFTRVWGWNKDDLILAAYSLLKEATKDKVMLKGACYICGGDGVYLGEPCTACNS